MTSTSAHSASRAPETQVLNAYSASGLGGRSVAWIQAARQAAIQSFAAAGFPHRKMETWRYTDLRRILPDAWTLAPARSAVGGHDSAETMQLRDALDAPGLWLRNLFTPGDGAMDALNLALADDGALIRVPAGAQLSTPVSVHHEGPAAGGFSHCRNLIHVEAGASAVLIETVSAIDGGSATAHSQIDLQDAANLTHIRIVEASAGAVWLAEDRVTVGAGGRYAMKIVQGGAGVVRCNPEIALAGAAAEAHLSAATLAHEAGHFDLRAALLHRGAGSVSRLRARTVVSGRSFAAVQGCVAVARSAQKSDSHQLTKSLLLSGQAQSVHKPELEIFADDVKCGHGATTGALSADQLFYLRARGVPEAQARRLLVAAFVSEIAEALDEGGSRVAAEGAIERLLAAAMAEGAT